LKVALNLTPVRRGGYRKGSPLDDVGTQRAVKAADVLPRLETPPAYGGPAYQGELDGIADLDQTIRKAIRVKRANARRRAV
jgi:hypothetical protein